MSIERPGYNPMKAPAGEKEMDPEQKKELKMETWRKLTSIASDLLDQSGQLSFTYGGKNIQAKYDKFEPNFNGSQHVCLKTDTGEFLPIRTKEFFKIPEIENLLKARINSSGFDSSNLQIAMEILRDEGIEF